MRKLSNEQHIAGLESKNAKLEKQVDTQAETITRLNHKVSRLTREKMHFKNKCHQLTGEKDHFKIKYIELAAKQRGGGK